ncbi:MAG: hypothetical protein PVH45_05400, partial [Candidatus Omnitrophota bacterium]
VFNYVGNKTAGEATSDDALMRQDTFRASSIEAVDDTSYTNRRSSTFFVGEKGEEIGDYTYSYSSDGNSVRTVGIFYYGNGGDRAEFSTDEDALLRQDSYRASSIGEADEAGKTNRRSSVFFNIRFGKGEEIADYSLSYDVNGERVLSTSVFFYGDALSRAKAAGSDDVQKQINTYRGELANIADVENGYRAGIKNITVNNVVFNESDPDPANRVARIKGEEIADYSMNFSSNGDTVTTTFFFYGGAAKRAEEASWADAVSQINTYQKSVADISATRHDTMSGIKSVTYQNIIDSAGGNRIKGDEVMDYTVNYNTLDPTQVVSTIVFFYGTGAEPVRAEEALADDATRQINTYNGLVVPAVAGSKTDIKSILYNHIEDRYKGEEVADYSVSFNRGDPDRVTTTTVFFYSAQLKRADEALNEDATKQINTYRGEPADIASITHDYRTGIKNITHNNIVYNENDPDPADRVAREKGEEVTDYSVSFNSLGQELSTTVFFYGDALSRAPLAMFDDVIAQINTYRGDRVGAGHDDKTEIKSITFNNIRDAGGDLRFKGEEVADYVLNYDPNDPAEATSTSVFFYGTARVRAVDAFSDEATKQTNTYRKELANIATVDHSYRTGIKSITHNNIVDSAGTARVKGEEITDHTTNFDANGGVSTTSVFYYGETPYRAEEALVDDVTSQINTYRGDTQGPGPEKTADDGLRSITYNSIRFAGELREKGEEVADYTLNYNTLDSLTSTAIYFYEDDKRRASQAGADDRTSQINTYGGLVAGVFTTTHDYRTGIRNITYNHIAGRLKGEEIGDYTQNYDSGENIINTSVYYYHDADDPVDPLKRAEEASYEFLTSQINTYRGDTQGPGPEKTADDGLRSITYNSIRFAGELREKGEEVADYTLNYNTLDSLTSTAIYFYEDDKRRASQAGADDRTSQINTYGGLVAGVFTTTHDYRTGIRNITYNHIAGRLKGEEIGDYTQNYDSGENIINTSVYYYHDADDPVDPLKRAEEASYEFLTSQINTYRGDTQGPGPEKTADDDLKSITYNDIEYREKGEEVA